VPQAGGPRLQPGDYLHFNGRASKLSEGSWGLIRVLETETPNLKKLPIGSTQSNTIPRPLNVCPSTAPVKSFNVAAIDFPHMTFNPRASEMVAVDFERKIEIKNPDAKIYILEGSTAPDLVNTKNEHPMPLVLRANIGDCLKIRLTNRLQQGRASFSALALAFDATDAQGMNDGKNPGDQTNGPSQDRTYTYLATLPLAKFPLWSGIGEI